MLRQLSIRNYALINELEIALPAGLTIITGETGAGKSILLGALELLLGARADSQSLSDHSRKCVVEGTFDIRAYQLRDFFTASDLDYADETTIRREITPEGKSRAFVNDTPVNVSVLKQLGILLVDIHSQHETLTLAESGFQLDLVDAFAANAALRASYVQAYQAWRQAEKKLQALLDNEAQSKKDRDYFRFQFDELEAAQLRAGEMPEAESELETLEHAETIKSALSRSAWALDGGEQNILSSLREVKAQLAAILRYHPAVSQLHDRLGSAQIELKDIASEIENLEGHIQHDPKRIEILQERLDMLYHLAQKHGVKTSEELIVLRDEFATKLEAIDSLDDQILAARKEAEKTRAATEKTAVDLSVRRKSVFAAIEKEIGDTLAQLGMPDAILSIEHTALIEPAESGIDKIRFLFTANKGSSAKPLDKVASGGEMSRLMLSLKALLTRRKALPTIIFDEIDTGISGDIAARAGNIMEQMSAQMQVIVITHLPQVASRGKSHVFVYKEEENGKTVTRLRSLQKEERIREIAKMLSAGNVSDAAMKNAKELLKA